MNIRNFYLRYGAAVVLYKNGVGPNEVDKIEEDDLIDKAKTETKDLIGNKCCLKPPGGDFSKGVEKKGTLMKNKNIRGVSHYSPPEDPKPVLRTHVLVDVGKRSQLKSPSGNKAQKLIYPPGTKLSIGKDGSNNFKFKKGYEYFSAVSTFTPLKIAIAKFNESGGTGWDRVGLFPDLSLSELIKYIDLIDSRRKSVGSLLKLRKSSSSWTPITHDGMYFRDYPSWLFGSISLIASINEFIWKNEDVYKAKSVVNSLKNSRVYLVSPEEKESGVEKVGEHLTNITDYKFKQVVDEMWKIEKFIGEYKMEDFKLFFRRWLKSWDWNSFRRFYSIRTLYPQHFRSLFKEYFKDMGFDKEVIQAFQRAGDYIGKELFHEAKRNVNSEGGGGYEDILEEKSSLVASLESSSRSSKSPADFVSRVTRHIERISGGRNANELSDFVDIVLTEQIDLEEAKQILFTKVRTMSIQSENSEEESDVEEEETVPKFEATA